MKRLMASTCCAVLLAACATPSAPNSRLTLYRAHAGAAVPSFRYLGRFDSWESLGDQAVAVWTRPHEAWLLELAGPCNGLDFAPAIGLTSRVGQVNAGFDKVLIDDPASIRIPCVIQTIRPLDVNGIRQVDQDRRNADASARADH